MKLGQEIYHDDFYAPFEYGPSGVKKLSHPQVSDLGSSWSSCLDLLPGY